VGRNTRAGSQLVLKRTLTYPVVTADSAEFAVLSLRDGGPDLQAVCESHCDSDAAQVHDSNAHALCDLGRGTEQRNRSSSQAQEMRLTPAAAAPPHCAVSDHLTTC
jgi:hypothetical protein